MAGGMFDDRAFGPAHTSDGAELLDDLLATITRYVVFPDEHAAVSVALWIAATHAVPAFQHAPRLVANSPEKRCGKSRLLDIIGGTCHRPLVSVNATVAAIFRSIGDKQPPTLIIDEADTLFGTKRAAEQNEDLRALLNAGHQRGRPALRCVGPQQIPTEFSTFAMAALAGIGAMPDTITDRAVNITMRRRTKGERVAQFRSRRDGPVLAVLHDRLASWAGECVDELEKAEPDMPVEDRAADTWEPLVAIADAAGGTWPARARAACVALVEGADEADEGASLSTRLLMDIKAVFSERGVAFLASADLVAALRGIEESPWNDFEFNPRKLAHRLKQFGVTPGHNTSKTARGYTLETLTDAFERYTRPEASDASVMPSDQVKQPDGRKSPDGSIRPDDSVRPDETAPQALFGTSRTDADGLPAENASTPGDLTNRSPGQTERVRQVLARVKVDGPDRCPECSFHLPSQGHADGCPERTTA